MEKIEILKKAIEDKKQISYCYSNPKKLEERNFIRRGNPHIIFYSASKDREEDKILIHIFEIKKEKEEINKWKPCEVKNLNNIKILETDFKPEKTYKPSSFYYRNGFIKRIE